jgi:hypothetical protein
MNRNTRYLLVAAVIIIALAGHTSAFFCDPFGPQNPTMFQAPCPFDGSNGAGAVDPFDPIDPSASQAPCPFDGSNGAGAVDPFDPIDPSASQAPCPFDGSNGAGAVDPASIVVPCPFPQRDTTSGEMISASGSCGGSYPAPTDVDGDGAYEDLNGNGRIDFADVILFFRNMDWIRENQPRACFDYNGNGNIDFADLILLFREV